MKDVLFRKIIPGDDIYLHNIITYVMHEFGANPDGTVLADPSIKKMYQYYKDNGSVYYVAVVDGIIAGGCGIKQLENTDEKICELQRMFLLPQYRGMGIGKRLLELSINEAKAFGYKNCYLESLSNMNEARKFYEKAGFCCIKSPIGKTGHSACDIFMLKTL